MFPVYDFRIITADRFRVKTGTDPNSALNPQSCTRPESTRNNILPVGKLEVLHLLPSHRNSHIAFRLYCFLHCKLEAFVRFYSRCFCKRHCIYLNGIFSSPQNHLVTDIEFELVSVLGNLTGSSKVKWGENGVISKDYIESTSRSFIGSFDMVYEPFFGFSIQFFQSLLDV